MLLGLKATYVITIDTIIVMTGLEKTIYTKIAYILPILLAILILMTFAFSLIIIVVANKIM